MPPTAKEVHWIVAGLPEDILTGPQGVNFLNQLRAAHNLPAVPKIMHALARTLEAAVLRGAYDGGHLVPENCGAIPEFVESITKPMQDTGLSFKDLLDAVVGPDFDPSNTTNEKVRYWQLNHDHESLPKDAKCYLCSV